jgi:hypothetical protein
MNARYSIGDPILLAPGESLSAFERAHYCHHTGGWVDGAKVSCAFCKLLETGDHLVTAEAATQIGGGVTPPRDEDTREALFDRRRGERIKAWLCMAVLVAVAIIMIPDQARLGAMERQHGCTPASAR